MESKRPVSDGQKSTEVETVGVLLGTIGDTTWRMFVPTVGLTLLGVWADTRILTLTGESATKPWFMVAGIVLGFLGAFLLIKKQLFGLRSRSKRSKK